MNPDDIHVEVMNPGEAAKNLAIITKLLKKSFNDPRFEEEVLSAETPEEAITQMIYNDASSTSSSYHTFSPRPDILKLLSLTDNKHFARPTPFRFMYMPLKLGYNGNWLSGLASVEYHIVTESENDRRYRDKVREYIEENKVDYMPQVALFSLSERDVGQLLEIRAYSPHGHICKYDPAFEEVKTRKNYRVLVRNMDRLFWNSVDYLNHPDVEVRTRRPRAESNEKRIKKGKPIMPSRMKITVTGKTKCYLDAVAAITKRSSPSHAFWVRGHWRHLTSDYYKNKQGEAIWVFPFIKGDGELIKRVYEMRKSL